MAGSDPFQAGFMVGLDMLKAQNDKEYKNAIIDRIKKEGELKDLQLKREMDADNAPGEFLQSIKPKDTGPLAAAPVPGYSNDEPASGPNGVGGIIAPPTDSKDPLRNTSGMEPGSAANILSQYTALGTGGMVNPPLEEKLANLSGAIAKAPKHANILTALAANDPDLNAHFNRRALAAKLGELELKDTFAAREDVRKSELDTTKTLKGKAFDYLTDTAKEDKKREAEYKVEKVGDTGGFAVFKNGAMAATFMPDPKDTSSFIHKDLKGIPDIYVIKSLLSKLEGWDKKTTEEKDEIAKATANNRVKYQELINTVGQIQGSAVQPLPNASGTTPALEKLPSDGTGGVIDFLSSIVSPAQKVTPGTIQVPGTATTPPYSKVPMAGKQGGAEPVLASGAGGRQSYVERLMQNVEKQGSGKGKSPGEVLSPLIETEITPQETASEARKTVDQIRNEALVEKFNKSGLLLGSIRKSVTVKDAAYGLQKAFPDLTEQQIAKILMRVTNENGITDLEALRENLGAFYKDATMPSGSMRRFDLPKPPGTPAD
jgi:hypothetical protein